MCRTTLIPSLHFHIRGLWHNEIKGLFLYTSAKLASRKRDMASYAIFEDQNTLCRQHDHAVNTPL